MSMETPRQKESAETRRGKSREIIRAHYHRRGWQSPYARYEALLGGLIGRGTRVLDVGCGRMFPMAEFLLGRGGEVHGIDPVADPQAAAPGVTFKRGSADDIPYAAAAFDVVTSRSVLEHLREPARAFAEFARVLKPGGRVVFLAANAYDYVSLFARLLPNALHGSVVKALEGRDAEDTFPTFYRANSAARIGRLASEAGLRIERLEYLNQFPYLFIFSPTLCRAVIAYDDLIGRVPYLRPLRGWLLGCLRKPL